MAAADHIGVVAVLLGATVAGDVVVSVAATDLVGTGTAVQPVGAFAADHDVPLRTAGHVVAVAAAGRGGPGVAQRVELLVARDLGRVDVDVALHGIGRRFGLVLDQQVHLPLSGPHEVADRGRRQGGFIATHHDVRAVATVHAVGATAADEDVSGVEAEAHLVVDHGLRLALGQHQHGSYVAAGATDQAVVAQSAARPVCAGTALDPVSPVAAGQVVATRATGDHVVVAATGGHVVAEPGVDAVVAGPAVDAAVVAVAGHQAVVQGASGQRGHARGELGGHQLALVVVGLAGQERDPVLRLATVGGEGRQRRRVELPRPSPSTSRCLT